MKVFETKFTRYPIGLDINHLEQEIAIAHHWNECIELGVSPDTPIDVNETRVHNFNHVNPETGLSVVNTGHAEEIGRKWKLTQKAIDKCITFLGIV